MQFRDSKSGIIQQAALMLLPALAEANPAGTCRSCAAALLSAIAGFTVTVLKGTSVTVFDTMIQHLFGLLGKDKDRVFALDMIGLWWNQMHGRADGLCSEHGAHCQGQDDAHTAAALREAARPHPAQI